MPTLQLFHVITCQGVSMSKCLSLLHKIEPWDFDIFHFKSLLDPICSKFKQKQRKNNPDALLLNVEGFDFVLKNSMNMGSGALYKKILGWMFDFFH